MRRMILGLCCLALAATPAWAQSTIKDAAILPVNHVRGGNCNDSCCAPKVCVAVPATIKHTTTCFSSKCIDYCLPKCSLQRGCDSCADNCGHPRTKHVLMMKRVTTECPATKCEVTLAPPASCAQPCGSTVGQRILNGHRNGGGTAPAAIETIPVAPTKK